MNRFLARPAAAKATGLFVLLASHIRMIDKNPSVGLPVEYKPAVEVDPNRITPHVLPPAKSPTGIKNMCFR